MVQPASKRLVTEQSLTTPGFSVNAALSAAVESGIEDSAVVVKVADLVPLPPAGGHKFRRDTFTATLTGDQVVTLGGDPEANSELIAVNGVVLTPSQYTLTGRSLTIPGVTATNTVSIQYAYPSSSTAAAATRLIISDTFTRADASTLGNAETGQAYWSEGTWGSGATWGIASNQARLEAPGGGAQSVATVNAGVADYAVQIKFAALIGSCGLAVRHTDPANNLVSNAEQFFRKTAGVNNHIGTFSTPFVTGDTQRIVCAGSTITVFRQAGSVGAFVQVLSVTETQGQTAARVGFRCSETTGGNRFDDFKVFA